MPMLVAGHDLQILTEVTKARKDIEALVVYQVTEVVTADPTEIGF